MSRTSAAGGGASKAAAAIAAPGKVRGGGAARANEAISRPAPQTPRRLPSSLREAHGRTAIRAGGHLVIVAQREDPLSGSPVAAGG